MQYMQFLIIILPYSYFLADGTRDAQESNSLSNMNYYYKHSMNTTAVLHVQHRGL